MEREDLNANAGDWFSLGAFCSVNIVARRSVCPSEALIFPDDRLAEQWPVFLIANMFFFGEESPQNQDHLEAGVGGARRQMPLKLQ